MVWLNPYIAQEYDPPTPLKFNVDTISKAHYFLQGPFLGSMLVSRGVHF